MADLWTRLPQLFPAVDVYRQQLIMLLLYKTRQIANGVEICLASTRSKSVSTDVVPLFFLFLLL